ncbi:MAG: hypothetical protein ACK5LX_09240 [Oscillospiraceae bacterium]
MASNTSTMCPWTLPEQRSALLHRLKALVPAELGALDLHKIRSRWQADRIAKSFNLRGR